MPGVGRGRTPGGFSIPPIPPPMQGRPTKSAFALDPHVRCRPGLRPRRNEPSIRIGGFPSPPQGFDLPRERPIFRPRNQSRTHGIHPHVIPLLPTAFAAAQQMVEKSSLPDAVKMSGLAISARRRPGLHPRRIIDPAARARAAYKIQARRRPGLCPRRFRAGLPADLGQMTLQRPDPTGQCLRTLHRYEQMHVVRHQYVLAHPRAGLFR